MSDPTFELARQIIARPSVTPDDAGCMDIFVERLIPLGFSIEFINRNGVTNLWARRGTVKPLFPMFITFWFGDPVSALGWVGRRIDDAENVAGSG